MASTVNTVLPVEELIAAAHELSVAGRWQRASRLLDACTADEPDPRARIARAAAQVALEQDWFAGTDTATARIEAAGKEFPDGDWDLDFARLRNTYRRLLVVDGRLRLGPDGKDPEALAALLREAEALRDSAPDKGRRGWAEMYLGLITDNHFADLAGAPPHYASALRSAESDDDPLLAREALRHLGDHDHDAGDHARALDRWRRAAELGAAAGTVPGTLSQQLLLAVLARDSGDEAGARALATEVERWAGAIGAPRLAAQARGFLAGVDPTAPPEESGS
jgi:tetratricopeptide (TPR) repeat protein